MNISKGFSNIVKKRKKKTKLRPYRSVSNLVDSASESCWSIHEGSDILGAFHVEERTRGQNVHEGRQIMGMMVMVMMTESPKL